MQSAKITKNLEKSIDKLRLICYHITVAREGPQNHGGALDSLDGPGGPRNAGLIWRQRGETGRLA
jgi:hypothetical protein